MKFNPIPNFSPRKIKGKQYTFNMSLNQHGKQDARACLSIHDFKHKKRYEIIIDESFFNTGDRNNNNNKIQGFSCFSQFIDSLIPPKEIDPENIDKKQFGQWISYYDNIQFAICEKGVFKVNVQIYNLLTKKKKIFTSQLQLDNVEQLGRQNVIRPKLQRIEGQGEVSRAEVNKMNEKEDKIRKYFIDFSQKLQIIEEQNKKLRAEVCQMKQRERQLEKNLFCSQKIKRTIGLENLRLREQMEKMKQREKQIKEDILKPMSDAFHHINQLNSRLKEKFTETQQPEKRSTKIIIIPISDEVQKMEQQNSQRKSEMTKTIKKEKERQKYIGKVISQDLEKIEELNEQNSQVMAKIQKKKGARDILIAHYQRKKRQQENLH